MIHLQYLCPRWKDNKVVVETAAEKDRAERMPPLVEEPAEDSEPDETKDQTKERTGRRTDDRPFDREALRRPISFGE